MSAEGNKDEVKWSEGLPTRSQAQRAPRLPVLIMLLIIVSDIVDYDDDDEWDERVDRSRHFMSGNWSH